MDAGDLSRSGQNVSSLRNDVPNPLGDGEVKGMGLQILSYQLSKFLRGFYRASLTIDETVNRMACG